jgi:hypothetical protein
VPTLNVSPVDVVIDVEKETTSEEVKLLKNAANGERGHPGLCEEPLVSDFKQNSNSSIVDAEYTKVIGAHDQDSFVVRQEWAILPRARSNQVYCRRESRGLSLYQRLVLGFCALTVCLALLLRYSAKSKEPPKYSRPGTLMAKLSIKDRTFP